MLAEITQLIEQEYIQWGFAGFCLILIGVIVWVFKQLLNVIKDNNRVLAKLFDALKLNTVAQQEIRTSVDNGSDKVDKLRERLLARPCLRGNNYDTD